MHLLGSESLRALVFSNAPDLPCNSYCVINTWVITACTFENPIYNSFSVVCQSIVKLSQGLYLYYNTRELLWFPQWTLILALSDKVRRGTKYTMIAKVYVFSYRLGSGTTCTLHVHLRIATATCMWTNTCSPMLDRALQHVSVHMHSWATYALGTKALAVTCKRK